MRRLLVYSAFWPPTGLHLCQAPLDIDMGALKIVPLTGWILRRGLQTYSIYPATLHSAVEYKLSGSASGRIWHQRLRDLGHTKNYDVY